MRAYESSEALGLAERLLLAIELGEDAGGDRHGARSATMMVIGDQPNGSYPPGTTRWARPPGGHWPDPEVAPGPDGTAGKPHRRG
ncbi:DUF1028 domain-containing protein [Verrucosispora sp. WMMD573]|uniref:DUF1028 domain-containing protein n=1 Tax=Verrucosispora sp. WMMD573 TaxID=3015149 RepID=UPI00248CDB64|nr:DUF1028 domain-containing protein [Verrucosispora sp. WMMD573]WBB54605.1 DUF1028 domain-containing protein [Verrucosispora sp. WMMD573]